MHAITELHPDDAECLYKLQAELDESSGFLVRLGQVARKEISWDEYSLETTIDDDDELSKLLNRIRRAADILLTTPGASCSRAYKELKDMAKGIVVDEVGCMGRPDLYSVWGNTLRPLFAAGDVKQLRPTVMEMSTKDLAGNYLNRFALCAKASALAYLQGTGMPVYRLRVQLRMCTDMFGLARELVYKDLDNFKYGPQSDPSEPRHAYGRVFENWLLNVRKFPGLNSSAEGSLEPVWMHTPGTKTFQVGTSRLNRAQVCLTLGLLSDFVGDTGVDAADIVVIAPYKPNVEYGNRQLSKYPQLAKMLPLQTADSFQGREGKMAVVIFGTVSGNGPGSGPGFTSDENRLNVMMTRQQCALLLVGDKLVTGALEGKTATLAKATKMAARGIRSFGVDGEATHNKAVLLREVLLRFHQRGRIFEVKAEELEDDAEEAGA
jgi:hypothetical protein